METNLVFLVFTLYSLVQGGDLDISLCDARQWYLKCAAEGLFDGPLTGSQESVQYEIEDILLKSRNDPTQRQIDCILLEQFENILKKKSKGNEGDNSEAINEMEMDETDILEEETEHDVTAPTENTNNKDEDNQEMDETNSLPDEVTHSSHLQSDSNVETSNASEDEDSKNGAEIGNVGQTKEQNGQQEMTTENNGEQFHVMEENEQYTIDQNEEYDEPQLQTTEHNKDHQHTMGHTDEQPQTSEQHGTNTQKEHNEEQHKSTEQSEHDDKVQQTTENSVEHQQTTDHSEEHQQTTEHSVEHQQTTEKIVEQTTIQSDDQQQLTEKGGDQQQKAAPQGEDPQNIKERNEGQTQTTDQNRSNKKTTEQSEYQQQIMEQNHKTQTTERNDESHTMEQNRAQPQAMERDEFQSEFIDSIIADLFQGEKASEQDNAAKTGSLNIEQTMPIQTQQNSQNADIRTHVLQDEAQLSGLTQEKEMQADKTIQTTEHLKTEMHEKEKGNEKHMEKETDIMMNTAEFDQTPTTEQHTDASPETNKIKPTDNISNNEHLQNVNDFDSESGYSDAEKDNILLNFGVCRTDKSSATDIFLSRYLPSINTNNESTTEKCSDCHGFESDNKNNLPDEFRDKDITMNKYESTVSSKKLVQKDNTHDKMDTVNLQNDSENKKQSGNTRTPDSHLHLSQEHAYSIKKDSKQSALVPSNENTNDEGYVLNRVNDLEPDDKTNDKDQTKEENVNSMQDANFNHMKDFFKSKTLEYSSQIQNLEILVIKLQNQLLMEKLDKQNHSTSITKLENSILKLENELLRLNHSHFDLKIENEKMNRQKLKYLQLDHVPKNDSKQANEITDPTSKSYEIITQQQSKITQLAELLKNQSKAIQHMKTRYDYLEDQNRMLFQMVMNQTTLVTQIMSRVQELSDQNMQHRIEAQSLKEKLAISKLSDKKEKNHISEVSNELLEKIDAIVSDKKLDMTDDRKSKTNSKETGKFGNEDETDETLKAYINKTKRLADITYNWCGKHRMVCIYKSIRLSTCVPFVPLYWSVCEERQMRDTTRPQMEYGYDRRKTTKKDVEELKEQIFNKVNAMPVAEDPKDRHEENADKNIKNEDTKSRAFVQGSENEIVEISKQSTESKPQTADVDKKAIEENVEAKLLKPTTGEITNKIKNTDITGNEESSEIKTSQQGVQLESIISPKVQDSNTWDERTVDRNPNVQSDSKPHENTVKPDIDQTQETLLTNSKPTTKEDIEIQKPVPKDNLTVIQQQDSKTQKANTPKGLPLNDPKEKNSKSIKGVQTNTGQNKESSEQKNKREPFEEPVPNEKPVKTSQQENTVLKQDKIPDNKMAQKKVAEDKPQVKTSKTNEPPKKKSTDKQPSTQHKKADNIKSQKLSPTKDLKIRNQEKKQDDKALDPSKQNKKEVKETIKQHKNHKENTLKEVKLRYPKKDQTEPKDCYDYYMQGYKRNSIYKIKPYGFGKSIQVYCDMKDGGWTLIQKRSDGTTKFFREWSEYKNGFGGLYGEHWLGNDYIHYLTNQDNYKLRIELTNWEKTKKFAEYDVFRVDDEKEGYKLTISGYTGDAGDGMAKHNGHKFSTKDVDNDKVVKEFGGSCANRFSGAWWYYKCYMSNLNGLYYRNGQIPPKMFDGITWKPWTGPNYSLRSVEMKIRPSLAKDK
ncbi:uncharacterized protein LOC143067507 [Mytilus galloprovincialis]|uniref:uncharacterized protein LOC143067507 n=1 Tax=Mytilus galloprovincialis TaxID=29158 RepID=UPI003F7B5158